MLTEIARFFSTKGFMPHGMCLLWKPSVLWTLVISNALIFISYVLIPLALVYVYVKRREFDYIWIFLLFGAFIVLCGITHLNTIITFWNPIYGFEALVDFLTGLVSFTTALVLWRLVPQLLSIPTAEQLRKQNADLKRTLAELRRSYESLDEFAYIASHDLKEPLRGISHFSTIIAEDYKDKLDDEGKYELATIKKLSIKMTQLIDGLHAYSRATRTDDKYEHVDIKALIEDKITLLENYLKTKNGSIQLRNEFPKIYCSRAAIGEILYNLMQNGIKYNDSMQPKVEITYFDKKDKHLFCVADNGIGLNKKELKKAFHIFRRVDGSEAYGEGTGIGLNIVERMVKHAGGEVWIESELGKGTKVSFTIRKNKSDGKRK